MNQVGKHSLVEALPLLDDEIIIPALHYDIVYDYIMKYGLNNELKKPTQSLRNDAM